MGSIDPIAQEPGVDAIREFFSSELFMPHGHCYLWKPSLLWLQVLSNGFIAATVLGFAQKHCA